MLAVTTRNVLKSASLGLPMMVVRRRVARQLATVPGLVRYASGVASPREFLTLTVWESRRAMQAFMQSGAHERAMWLFSQWTESFWSMRWEPDTWETGAWSGLRLSAADPSRQAVSPLVAAGLLPANPPRAGATGPRRETEGVEPRGSGLVCVTARLEGFAAVKRAAELRRRLDQAASSEGGPVRWTIGLDLPAQAMVVSLWREAGVENAAEVLRPADWAMRWRPGDYEIGHWGGLRLRQAARIARHDREARGGPPDSRATAH